VHYLPGESFLAFFSASLLFAFCFVQASLLVIRLTTSTAGLFFTFFSLLANHFGEDSLASFIANPLFAFFSFVASCLTTHLMAFVDSFLITLLVVCLGLTFCQIVVF
jgi:hypothetical protein